LSTHVHAQQQIGVILSSKRDTSTENTL
jgi:hypothetical protein